MLNNKGPRMDPCGTQYFSLRHELYELFTLDYLKIRKQRTS